MGDIIKFPVPEDYDFELFCFKCGKLLIEVRIGTFTVNGHKASMLLCKKCFEIMMEPKIL